jgi:hypothetical protein
VPYGPLIAVRQAMLYAKPWQQALICLACVAAGIGLLIAGHLARIAPILFGVVFLVPLGAARIRR